MENGGLEKTLIVIKPDGFRSGRLFEILSRFERAGLRFSQGYTTTIDEEFARKHYKYVLERFHNESQDEIGEAIVRYITSGPVFAAIITGNDAVDKSRKLAGEQTEPSKCPPGTIRFDYGNDTRKRSDAEGRGLQNIIHTSDSKEAAERELELWFWKYSPSTAK